MNYRMGMMIQESKRGEKLWRYRVDGRILFVMGIVFGIVFGFSIGWMAH